MVPPPEVVDAQVSTQIHAVQLPLAENKATGWLPHHLFVGVTGNVELMGAHVSVLSPGHCPHLPHAHREEELLIVLDGRADLIIADGPDTNVRLHKLEAGSFVFYPAYQHHTLRNDIAKPITYLMFKWRGSPAGTKSPLATSIVKVNVPDTSASPPFSVTSLLEGGTTYLTKLHSHLTVLKPGAGYDAHADDHDVTIVILRGRVESMGHTLKPHGVLFYAAGEMHDMRNVGDGDAHYLVFEFHRRLIEAAV